MLITKKVQKSDPVQACDATAAEQRNIARNIKPQTSNHKLFLFIFAETFNFMNLHEYQAKELLKKYNVPVQEGIPCSTPGEAEQAYRQIHTQYGSNFAVVKAQIHAGGRGKGKIAGTEQRGGKRAGERAQCFCGIARIFNVGASAVQRGSACPGV